MAAKKTNKSKPKRDTKVAGRSRSPSGSKKAASKSSPKKGGGKPPPKAKAKAGKKGPAKGSPKAKPKISKKKPAAKAQPKKPAAAKKKTPTARAPKKSSQASKAAPAAKTPTAAKTSAAKAPAAKALAATVTPVKAPSAKPAPAVKAAPPPSTRSAKLPSKPPEKARGRGRGDRVAYSRVGKPLAGTPVVAVRKASPAPSRPAADKPSTPRDAGRDATAREPGRESGLRESNRPPAIVSLPIPVLPVPARPSVEERAKSIEERLAAQDDDFRHRYQENFDMSWIYHDSALEGVVYTYAELRAALGNEPLPVTDSSLQPTVEDIRRHKEAIEYVRDFAIKKARLPVTIDVIKKIYLILHPSEGDIKTVKYRKDIPQHRLYFHEYAPPDKVAYKVRQVVDWINDPETRKTRNGLRLAARAHYDLLRVFPFPTDSGKVCRLFMNLLLMRTGLPPAIIHSTERQRYYDALKGSANTVLSMVQEAVENALASVEKLLDEHETKTRAFVS
jgi:hypothetical protein